MTHSPTPPPKYDSNGKLTERPEAWEFSAIPWTFPLDQAQTIKGWEPFAVGNLHDANEGATTTCLLVRRPA